MPLSFDNFRHVNETRCELDFRPIASWSASDWAVALAGECGEVCDAVKKLNRLSDGTNTAKDPQTLDEHIENIAMELADTVCYADLLAARLGIDLGAAVRRKFNIVSKRMNSNITF